MAQVVIDGLKELRRDLRRMEPEADKEVRQALKTAGDLILTEARAKAPRGTRPLPANRRRRLAAGGRVSVTAREVRVVWPQWEFPQAGVVHWGGEIRPRGVPIRFKATRFVWDTAIKEEPRFVQLLERELDGAFRRLGW